MTYLQLVQRLRSECGVAGDGPSTVVGQTREMGRLCSWVQQSWIEIQHESPEWLFLRKSVTFNTVANQQTYQVGPGLDIDLSDFATWRNDSFRQYLQSAGIATQIILRQYYNYSDFRDFYLLGSRQLVTARPMDVTIAPDKSVLFGFTPNDIYVTTAEYYRTPQELTADADVPIIPDRYHMAIVYKAMQKYGLFESAQEQIQAGKEGYSQLLNRMRAEYTTQVMSTGNFI